jgi:hypothetical protein
MLYVIDITYYNIILGLAWLDYVNLDIQWPKREWFYRDYIAAVKEFSEDDFAKSLKKKTIIYAFYKALIELEKSKQRLACDKQEIIIYLTRTESILLFKYKTYENIFLKKEYKTVPKGTGITHAINLEKKIKPPYGLIYTLLK